MLEERFALKLDEAAKPVEIVIEQLLAQLGRPQLESIDAGIGGMSIFNHRMLKSATTHLINKLSAMLDFHRFVPSFPTL